MKRIYVLTINLNTLKIKHLNKVSAAPFGVLSNTFSKEKQRTMNYGCLEIGKAFKCCLRRIKGHIYFIYTPYTGSRKPTLFFLPF